MVESRGMIAGGVAMVVACTVGVVSVRLLRARRGAVVMCLAWVVVAVIARVGVPAALIRVSWRGPGPLAW